jgi:hypothetical protein
MKIIAKTDSTGYLLSASEREIANLLGFGSAYSLPEPHKNRHADNRFIVGQTIDISNIYAAVEIERGRAKKIAAQAKSLRALADEIDSINTKLASALTEVTAA